MHQAIHRAEMLGENLRGLPPNVPDIQTEDEPGEGAVFAGFDGIEHVVGAFIFDAIQRK